MAVLIWFLAKFMRARRFVAPGLIGSQALATVFPALPEARHGVGAGSL